MAAGGRWRSSSAPAGSSSTPRRSPQRLGFEVDDAATGGASDANTTSGMGVPTLDGLGPIGGNDHAPGGVPRGRLDRAADDAARRAAAGGRARSGGPRLARRTDAATAVTERRPDLVGRAVGGVAGYSRAVVVGDSCWVAGTTDAGPDGRSRHPGDIGGPGAGASSRSSSARSAEAGFAPRRRGPDADVRDRHRPMPPRCSRSTARCSATSGRRRRWSRCALMDPSLLVEIEAEARRG